MAPGVDHEGIGQGLLPALGALAFLFSEALLLQNLEEHLFLHGRTRGGLDGLSFGSEHDGESRKPEDAISMLLLLSGCLRLAEPVDARFAQGLSETFRPKLPSVPGPADFELLGEGKLAEL